jgi:hypothetical protein
MQSYNKNKNRDKKNFKSTMVAAAIALLKKKFLCVVGFNTFFLM